MAERILITGGAGFIGSNFIHLILKKRPADLILNVDVLTYAGNLENLKGVEESYGERYRFVRADIRDAEAMQALFDEFKPDIVLNFAAESHVDRSIQSAIPFISTNVMGTQILLDESKRTKVKRFIQISTDEVYGSLGATGLFREDTPLSPNSPYAASKTSADLMVRAAFETFKMPVLTTRCSNNYGPFQFPEKLIPLMISNAMTDQALPVYGDGMNVRDWLHVEDHCQAILTVLEKGREGEVYNIGGNNEKPNIEIVKTILKVLNKPESLIRYVTDRPGHDRRYAIDASKIAGDLGWTPSIRFEDGIASTIAWYQDNRQWWEDVKSGAYLEYYEQHYGARLK